MRDRFLELVNRALDDELSPSERHELDQAVASDGDAAAILQDHMTLGRLLSSVPEQEAPSHLKSSIMSALPRRKAVPAGPAMRTDLVAWIRRVVSPQPKLAYALAFSIGLVVGMGLLALVGNGNGMGVAVPGATGSMAGLPSIEAAGVIGNAELWVLDDGDLSVRLEIRAEGPVRSRIDFDATNLAVQSISDPSADGSLEAVVGADFVEWTVDGPTSLLIQFGGPDQAQELLWSIERDGNRVASQKLPVP